MLRQATAADVRQIVAIQVAGFRQVAEPHQVFPTEEELAPEWLEWLASDGPHEVLVWQEAERVLGVVGTDDSDDSDALGAGGPVMRRDPGRAGCGGSRSGPGGRGAGRRGVPGGSRARGLVLVIGGVPAPFSLR